MSKKQSQLRKRKTLQTAAERVGLRVTNTNLGCMPNSMEDIVSDLEGMAVAMRALGIVDAAMACPTCGEVVFEVELVLVGDGSTGAVQ